jgi:hypothetical protein
VMALTPSRSNGRPYSRKIERTGGRFGRVDGSAIFP